MEARLVVVNVIQEKQIVRTKVFRWAHCTHFTLNMQTMLVSMWRASLEHAVGIADPDTLAEGGSNLLQFTTVEI